MWNSLQSFVQISHRKMRDDVKALSKTVYDAWDSYFREDVFKKVYGRWQQVLQIIIDDNGDNRKIDSHRRKLLAPVILPPDSNPIGVC